MQTGVKIGIGVAGAAIVGFILYKVLSPASPSTKKQPPGQKQTPGQGTPPPTKKVPVGNASAGLVPPAALMAALSQGSSTGSSTWNPTTMSSSATTGQGVINDAIQYDSSFFGQTTIPFSQLQTALINGNGFAGKGWSTDPSTYDWSAGKAIYVAEGGTQSADGNYSAAATKGRTKKGRTKTNVFSASGAEKAVGSKKTNWTK